jgi:hypothetical protein
MRRYHWIDESRPADRMCDECGAAVANTREHDRWHNGLDARLAALRREVEDARYEARRRA